MLLQAREEQACDRNAARALLPSIRIVGEALAWAGEHDGALVEAAEELWVDEATLRARLQALHPAERAYLRRRLERPSDLPHVGHTGTDEQEVA